jgi:hypothetical protein
VDIVASLVTVHSFWRYAVLIAAVIALVVAFAGWLGPMTQRTMLQPVVRRAGALYITALDIQALIGIIIWLGKGWYGTPGFYRAEHPATMILAVIAAHVGMVLAKRSPVPVRAARAVALGVAVSLVLVVAGLRVPGVLGGG